MKIIARANNQIPVFAGRMKDSPQKAPLGLEKRFYLGLSFIGRIFLEKMDFEESRKNGQISKKNKEVNLNFLTILNQF